MCDSNDARFAFEKLRKTIADSNELIRNSLLCIANRLRMSGAGQGCGYLDKNALSDLKRELRDWDMNKQQWRKTKA